MLVRHPCMALVPNFTRAFPPSELSFSLTGCERYAPIIFCCYSLFRGSSPGSSSSLFLRHESKTNCFPRRRREERSFFFSGIQSLCARRKGRRRRRRRRPLFCARQRRKRSFVRPRRRGVKARAPREERERERERNLNFSSCARAIQNDDDKNKENVCKKEEEHINFSQKRPPERDEERGVFFFSTIYELIACLRNRADCVSVSMFSITNYLGRSLCARWRRRRCW